MFPAGFPVCCFGTKVTVPVEVGVIEKLFSVSSFLKLKSRTSESPAPSTVILIIPANFPSVLIKKGSDAVFTNPAEGPAKSKSAAKLEVILVNKSPNTAMESIAETTNDLL